MKAKSKAVRKHPHVCRGGPFNGQTLYMTSGGTLPIVVTLECGIKYAGRYDASMQWVGQQERVFEADQQQYRGLEH